MSYNFSNCKTDIKKVEEWLSKEYQQIHTGRATPSLLDGVSVESYGMIQPLKNITSISIEGPRTLRVVPWDKNNIKSIEKGITNSNLGLSTSVDESGLRVNFPELTTENREKLVKILKEKMEDARISVRQERERFWAEIQKVEEAGELNEDEKFRAKEELQKIVEETNKALERIFEHKKEEILTI